MIIKIGDNLYMEKVLLEYKYRNNTYIAPIEVVFNDNRVNLLLDQNNLRGEYFSKGIKNELQKDLDRWCTVNLSNTVINIKRLESTDNEYITVIFELINNGKYGDTIKECMLNSKLNLHLEPRYILTEEDEIRYKLITFDLYDDCVNEFKTEKRKDYISWDEFFMKTAETAALRSKDPRTQVGSCIVRDNKILSVGYNGFPNGCDDDMFPWGVNDDDILNDKSTFVVHSELNAILNYKGDLTESTIYVTLFPCNECAKAIIQAGIKKVIYKIKRDSDKYKASEMMFKSAGVKYVEYLKEEEIEYSKEALNYLDFFGKNFER